MQNINRQDVMFQKGVQKRVTMYITECDIHVIKSDEMKWRSWIHQNHENKWIRRWSKSGSKMSTPNINKAAIKSKKGPKKGVQKWARFEQKGPSQRLNGFPKMNTKLKNPTFWWVSSKSGYPLLRVDLSVRTHKTRKWKNRKRAVFEPLKWSLFVKNRMWVWSKK